MSKGRRLAAAINALRADARRDVYEGACGRRGSGKFYITYQGGVGLSRDEVDDLVRDGWLTPEPELPTMWFRRGPKLSGAAP